jgi:hypothetical protein
MLLTILEIQWHHGMWTFKSYMSAGGSYVNLMVESPAIQFTWWLDQPQK